MITVFADRRSPLTASVTARVRYIIAQPNHSASWQSNKQIIVIIGLISGVIATGFSLLGAWLVLPFAGIEITALGGALYIVCRQSHRRHVLYFDGDKLRVEKGIDHPEQCWQLCRSNTRIHVEQQAHHWDPIKINLYYQPPSARAELIPIGDFLNKNDSQRLLELLRDQGLIVINYSSNTRQFIG